MNSSITGSLPVISLVMVGFLLKTFRVFVNDDGALFSRIILNITLPCVIFLSIFHADIEPGELLILAACGLAISLLLRILAGGVTRILKLDNSIAGVVILASMVMNVGSLMIPVVQTVYGAEAVSRTAAFDIGNSMMASGYGYYLATRFGSKIPQGLLDSLKKVLSVPLLWAVIIGVVFNLMDVTLPSFITKMLTPLSLANTPLAMISLGIFVSIKFPRWKLVLMTVFLRMGVGFLLGQLIIFITHIQGMNRMIVTMGSAMPIGMVPLAYAATEGLDTEFAAACISLSIIIGLIITPFLLSV